MKLPVAFTLGNREASLDKDALMRNALAEVAQDVKDLVRARKRPCIDSAFTAATGQGQALFTWTIPGPLEPVQMLVVISDDTLNTDVVTSGAIQKFLSFSVEPS